MKLFLIRRLHGACILCAATALFVFTAMLVACDSSRDLNISDTDDIAITERDTLHISDVGPDETVFPEFKPADTSMTPAESDTDGPALGTKPIPVPPDSDPTPNPGPDPDPDFPVIDADTNYEKNGILYVRLFGASVGVTPGLRILRSMDDWNAFLVTPIADMPDTADGEAGSLKHLGDINDAFFETHALAVVQTSGASSSVRYTVTVGSEDGKTVLTLYTEHPAQEVKDIAYWAILVPIPKETTDGDVVLRVEDDTFDAVTQPTPEEGIDPHALRGEVASNRKADHP